MPRGDRTGPRGVGSMTGRAAGYCAGGAAPGYVSAGGGLGRGGGWGGAGAGAGWGPGGHGYRHQFYASGLTGWQRGVRGPGAWGMPFAAPAAVPVAPTREQMVAGLQAQARNLEQALSEVRDQLAELESEEQ